MICNCSQPDTYCSEARQVLTGAMWIKFHDSNHPEHEHTRSMLLRLASRLAAKEGFHDDNSTIVEAQAIETPSNEPCSCSVEGYCPFYKRVLKARTWKLAHGIGLNASNHEKVRKLLLETDIIEPMVSIEKGKFVVIPTPKRKGGCGCMGKK